MPEKEDAPLQAEECVYLVKVMESRKEIIESKCTFFSVKKSHYMSLRSKYRDR